MRPEIKPLLVAMLCFFALASLFVLYIDVRGLNPSLMIAQIDYDNESLGRIYGDTVIGQSFFSNGPNLTRIDVLFATSTQKNNEEIIFHVKELSSHENIVNISIPANELHNEKYYSVIFDPLPESENTTYYFSLSSPSSTKGNAVSVYSTTLDSYMMGSGYLNNSKIQGDFTFKTFHAYSKNDFWDPFLTKLFYSPFFFIAYGFLLLLSLCGIIIAHRRVMK